MDFLASQQRDFSLSCDLSALALLSAPESQCLIPSCSQRIREHFDESIGIVGVNPVPGIRDRHGGQLAR
ncbi:MAG: hypothetical protein NVS3B20_13870 [Polyangiales bacterium]